MKFDPINRRMFLRGGSGFLLSIPTLYSLLPKAFAQAGTISPKFIFISCQNGGQQEDQWFPSTLPSTKKLLVSGGGQYSLGDHYYHMDNINFNATTGISPIFDKKFNSLASKMNFVRGLDQRFTPFGNHRGAPLLGNVNSAHGSVGAVPAIPTIDQIMGYSDDFYPNNGYGYIPAVTINTTRNFRQSSFYFSNPTKKSGDIVSVPFITTPASLFHQLFGGTSALKNPDSRTPRVDDVLKDYKRTIKSNKLSLNEKNKLQEMIDNLAEYEKKITVDVVPNSPSCKGLEAPSSTYSSDEEEMKAIIDILMLAFMCERTRVANIHFIEAAGIADGSSHSEGTWHWSSHNPTNPLGKATLQTIYKWVADNCLYPMVSRLDSTTETNGKSMLDNSLVHFATSSAHFAHNNQDLPTLLFGSANGFFKTGNYVDYRDRDHNSQHGLLHNQYLTNVMYSMGLTYKDWDLNALGLNTQGWLPSDAKGYGWYKHIGGMKFYSHWSNVESIVADPLPGIVDSSKYSIFGT